MTGNNIKIKNPPIFCMGVFFAVQAVSFLIMGAAVVFKGPEGTYATSLLTAPLSAALGAYWILWSFKDRKIPVD